MSPESLRFSIVVPTYLRPVALRQCLASLAALDYPSERLEVIVVDDGGDQPLDGAVDPFRKTLKLQLIHEENDGPGPARNAGAAIARGVFLAFTDDDCQPAPDWLRTLEAQFEKTPGQIIGGRTINQLENNPYSTASQVIVDVVYAYYDHNPLDAKFFASNNMAIPTARFREIGGFDSEFRVASEDRELCDRWRHLGHKLTYVPQAVVHHHHHLSLWGFCRQHFNYGRGARLYHRVRSRRGSGRLRYDLPFYARLLQLLRKPLSRMGLRQIAQVGALLVIWQLVNTAGFLRGTGAVAKMRSHSKETDPGMVPGGSGTVR